MESVPTEAVDPPTANPGRLWVLALAALLLAHFLGIALHFAPAISSPDANGYFAQGARIATTGQTGIITESPLQFVENHWVRADEGIYYSQYPPGFPLIIAAVYRLAGGEASLWVVPVMATLSLLAIALVGRAWIGPWWGLLAAALLALNPTANEHALFADSHTAVLFFLLWGLFAMIRWLESDSKLWAIAGGFLLGVIPSIRYPEVIFIVPVALLAVHELRRAGKPLGSFVLFVLGAAIPIGALCIRNQLAFGAFWRTGYLLSGDQTGFGLNYFLQHMQPYAQMLLGDGVGFAFALAVFGVALLCAQRATRSRGLLLLGLAVPITLLYMAYYWPADGMSMRFLLPTFPVYILAAVWFLERITANQPRLARTLGVLTLLIAVSWGLTPSIRSWQRLRQDDAPLVQVTRFLEAHAQPGSIVIGDSQVDQHLDFIGRWRLADAAAIEGRSGGPGGGMQQNRRVSTRGQDIAERYSGLGAAARFSAVLDDLSAWAGNSRRVYWLVNENSYDDIADQSLEADEFVEVARLQLPARQDAQGGRGRFGGFGPNGMGGPAMGPPPGMTGPGGMPPGMGGPGMGLDTSNGPLLLLEWRPPNQTVAVAEEVN